MNANARNGYQYRQMARQLVLAGWGMRLLSGDGQVRSVRSSGAGYAVPGAVDCRSADWGGTRRLAAQLGASRHLGSGRVAWHASVAWHACPFCFQRSPGQYVHVCGTGCDVRDWIVGSWDRRDTEESGVLQRGTADTEQMCWILQDGRCVAVHGGCVVTVGVTGKGLDVVVVVVHPGGPCGRLKRASSTEAAEL